VTQTLHTHSWLKRFKHNKKGMSSIVGAVFMIMIIGILASGYFVFTLAQNSVYNDAVRSDNSITLMQMSESIKVPSAPTYAPSGSGVQVSVTLENDGPIGVQVKTLWIETDVNNYGFAPIDHYLSPGESWTPTPITVNPQSGAINSENCFGWIITGRGRTFELYPDHGIGPQGPQGDTGATGPQGPAGPQGPQGTVSYDANTALVSQGIGSIAMNFKTFRTYIVDVSSHLTNESPAYTFSLTQTVAFKLNVTNMDPTGDIYLASQSSMWIFSPASGAIKGVVWTIATVSNNIITPLPAGQFVRLPYNQSTTLYFGPKQAGNNNIDTGITGVNLILYGTIGTGGYGQNLPFISLMATT
jgi:hypothetical protein